MKKISEQQFSNQAKTLVRKAASEHEHLVVNTQVGQVIIAPLADQEEMVEVPIDIDDETFLTIAKLAHENDITFNQMVCRMLVEGLRDNKIAKLGAAIRATTKSKRARK